MECLDNAINAGIKLAKMSALEDEEPLVLALISRSNQLRYSWMTEYFRERKEKEQKEFSDLFLGISILEERLRNHTLVNKDAMITLYEETADALYGAGRTKEAEECMIKAMKLSMGYYSEIIDFEVHSPDNRQRCVTILSDIPIRRRRRQTIYDEEDRTILTRIIVRKGYETARITVRKDISDSRRMMTVDTLVRQISCARMMREIGDNDVADLENMIPALEQSVSSITSNLTEDYMSSLSPDEAEDEGQFVWMMGELIRQLPLLKLAVRFSKSEKCGLGGDDENLAIAVRGIMKKMYERCDGQDPEILGSSQDYIRTVCRQCSTILRVCSVKAVSGEFLSNLVRELDTVFEGDFDSLFADLLSKDERRALERFRENTGKYVASFYARCILNANHPEIEIISDSPANRQPSTLSVIRPILNPLIYGFGYGGT